MKNLFLEAVNVPLLTNQYKKQYPNATEDEINKAINLCAAADPTINKKYTSWIFREYLNNRIRLPEDRNLIQQNLTFFENNKAAIKRLNKSIDITSYNKNELWILINELENANIKSKRQEIIDIKKEGVEKIYQDAKYLIIKVIKGEACSYYAKNTKWCTSNVETAEDYLQEGPIYIIYENGKIFGQLHISSDQFMDELDNYITPNKIPQELKTIIINNIPTQNETENKKLHKLLGIHHYYLKFPDGFGWIYRDDDDDETLILINNQDEKILKAIIDNNSLISINFINSNFKDFEMFKGQKYNIKNYIKYIIPLLKSDIIENYSIFNADFILSSLSDKEKEDLFQNKPNFIKGIFFKTSNNNLWIKENDKSNIFITYKLLNENYKPIIFIYCNLFSLNDDVKMNINYGSWIKPNSIVQFLQNSEEYEYNQKDFSKDIKELILNENIQYINPNNRNINNFNFSDLEEMDQKEILNKHPYFNNIPAYYIFNTKDKKIILQELKKVFYEIDNRSHYDLTYFDENDFIMRDSDLIKINFTQLIENRNIGFTLIKINSDILRKILKNAYSKYNQILNSLNSLRSNMQFENKFGFNDKNIKLMGELIENNLGYDLFNFCNFYFEKQFTKNILILIYSYLIEFNNTNFKFYQNGNVIQILTNFDIIYKNVENIENIINLYNEFKENVKINFKSTEVEEQLSSINFEVNNKDFETKLKEKFPTLK